MSVIKIVFLSAIFGPMAGGGEISTRLLFNGLKRAGNEVYLITSRKTFPFDGLITLKDVCHIPLKVIVPGTQLTDLILAKYINKTLKELNPDIIHVHDRFTLPATCIANRKLRIPCVFTCRSAVLPHRTRAITPKGYAVKAFFELRTRNCLRYMDSVDAIISISDFIRQELLTATVGDQKVKTIFNIPSDLPKNSTLSSQLHSKTTVTLFTAGRLDADKGFDIVIKAMNIFIKKNPNVNVHLIIAGNGPQLRYLKKTVSSYSLERFVTLTGWVSHQDVMRFYDNSDIVFLPSVFPDAFGRGSLEALSFGKPVLASNVGGIHEIVIDDVNGFLFPPGDADLLATALSRLVYDPHLRERMGKAGQEIIDKRFSSDALVAQTLKLYENLIKSNRLTRT